MSIFTLSAANGLCRSAEARNLVGAIGETLEYANALGSDASLLNEDLKVIGKVHRSTVYHDHGAYRFFFANPDLVTPFRSDLSETRQQIIDALIQQDMPEAVRLLTTLSLKTVFERMLYNNLGGLVKASLEYK